MEEDVVRERAALQAILSPAAIHNQPTDRQEPPLQSGSKLADLLAQVAGGQMPPEVGLSRALSGSFVAAEIQAAFDTLDQLADQAIAGLGDAERTAAAWEILTRLGDPMGLPPLFAHAAGRVGMLRCVAGDNELGRTWLQRAVGAARESGEPAVLSAALGNLANADRNTGRFHEALLEYDEAITVELEPEHAPLRINHLNNRAILLEDLGETSLQEQSLLQARTLARGFGLRSKLAGIEANLGSLTIAWGSTRMRLRHTEVPFWSSSD